ncbi:MAG: methyltransferase, partial [Gemmatimonadota bacterium]|nr:methyltransferase [Gemmatimonadota bacterium]
MQIFSAGAATVEDRKARMKLPVRFARILFLRSPGASSFVRAGVQQFNEEFIEGGIGLYDEAGKPCVLVDGFRAISLAAARRSGAPGGSRDLLYHIEWERTPAAAARPALRPPVPLARLRDVARVALEEVIAVRGRAELEATMAAEDELAAAQIARGLREMGAETAKRWTADSLGVAEPMRAVFAQLVADLTKRELLETEGDSYRPTAAFARAADSAPEVLRSFLSKHPGHLPEGLLCATTCAELGPILRGEKEAVQVLFSGAGGELLDQFYGDGLFASHWMAAIASAVQEAARHLPEGRGLRILEVGAGTGGLAALLLPLLQRGLHTYVFSDVSAAFFPGAMQKLAAFPEVECKVLDLEKPGTEQGFEAGTFDLVLGTNVLHAVADVRAALKHIHELLAPGGSLLFMDVATPQLWIESVFGLTSGWWHFTDRDLRTDQPLLQRSQWESVMQEAGFSETASLPGLRGPRGGEGQIGLLARKAWHEVPVIESPRPVETPAEKSWVVFADGSGVGDRLAGLLAATGVRCRVARRGGQFALEGVDAFTLRAEAPEDWQQLLEAWADDAPPERLVYLWSLDEPTGDAALMGTDALLHLTQAIENTTPAAKLRIDLVTRGAQPVGERLNAVAVAQAPSIGVFRVMLSEHPNFSCRGIDLPPAASPSDDALLWSELLQADTEREIAFRGDARYVQRIDRGLPTREQWLNHAVPLRLESRERGLLDTLRFVPFALPGCGPGEVLIEVKAAGMNFRDVLKALALYPAETPDARVFGDEVA